MHAGVGSPNRNDRSGNAPKPPDADGAAYPPAQRSMGVLLLLAVLYVAGQACYSRYLVPTATSSGIAPPRQRIDINSATRAELLLLPGIGEQLSSRIVEYRAVHGPFQSVDELRHVPGIGPITLQRLRPWLEAGDGTSVVDENDPPPVAVLEPATKPGARPPKGTELAEPLDINAASAADLQKIPGIGPVMSKRLIEERDKKAFVSVDDLRRVKGIGPKVLEKMRPFVTVGDPVSIASR